MVEVRAQMAGTVCEVCVNVGEQVFSGQTIVILKFMDLEIPFESEKEGTISKVFVQEGNFVCEEDLLVLIQ